MTPAIKVRLAERPGGRAINNVALLVALVILILGMSYISPRFLTATNLLNSTRFMAEIGLIAVGMTVVVISGGIDLSVGSVMTLTAVCLGIAVEQGVNPWLAACVTMILGALLGALNGLIITRLVLPPIIVTLATLAIFRGIALGVSEAKAYAMPPSFAALGQGYIGPVPVQLLVFSALTMGVGILLSRSTFGRVLYAIGTNETVARFAGLRVDRAKLIAFSLSGFLSAVAAVIFVARVSSAKANAGLGYELDAITIVVLGGTAISGGHGNVLGTVLGLVLVGLARNGMTLAFVQGDVQAVVIGFLLIVAVIVNRAFAGSGSLFDRYIGRHLRSGSPMSASGRSHEKESTR
jgi:rhamnose transport system permease protein